MFETKQSPIIAVLGSCSVDFTTYAPRLPLPGETIHGTKFTTSYGGKGANQCIAAARTGGITYMICRLGSDQWGFDYKEHLKKNGVDVSYVHITPNTTTGIAQISVAESGENQIVIVPGANGHLSVLDVHEAVELIKLADVLVGQLETPFKTTLEAFKLNNGIKILNAAPAKSNIEEILPYCNVLCVNEPEATLLTNITIESVLDAAKALAKLLEYGCETAIITLGDNGAVYSSKQDSQPIHVLCDKVTPVDTTGAGDAFVGAFATYLAMYRDKPFYEIVGAACNIATVSVTKEGTQTSYPTDFNAFEKRCQHKRLE